MKRGIKARRVITADPTHRQWKNDLTNESVYSKNDQRLCYRYAL